MLNKNKIIIFGCGISGATIANIFANKNWLVEIYEKNNYVGGKCYDYKNKNGILIHKFGPHIFHTSNKIVYNFLTRFCKLNNFINKVLVNDGNKPLYPLPINFQSIMTIDNVHGKYIINKLKQHFPKQETISLFDALAINDQYIKEFVAYVKKNVYISYTTKMWGMKFNNVDHDIINRVKIILGYQHNYFPLDKYQGLPIGGYTSLIKKMINHKNITIKYKTNANRILKFNNKNILLNDHEIKFPIIYCGSLDELLKYKYGILGYRSLNIHFKTLPINKFQSTAVINYPNHPKITRIVEYKQMTKQKINNTTISMETPGSFDIHSKLFQNRFYPLQNSVNKAMYKKYYDYFKKYYNFYTLGRLGKYTYIDMDDAILNAIKLAKKITHEKIWRN